MDILDNDIREVAVDTSLNKEQFILWSIIGVVLIGGIGYLAQFIHVMTIPLFLGGYYWMFARNYYAGLLKKRRYAFGMSMIWFGVPTFALSTFFLWRGGGSRFFNPTFMEVLGMAAMLTGMVFLAVIVVTFLLHAALKASKKERQFKAWWGLCLWPSLLNPNLVGLAYSLGFVVVALYISYTIQLIRRKKVAKD